MTPNLTLTEARAILDSFSCLKTKTVSDDTEKEKLRQALLLFVGESEGENLGVCANSSDQGYRALANYLKAFGYRVPFVVEDLELIDTPVYLKFNTGKATYYIDAYTGDYRGVLVSCQSEDDLINGTFGHLPLDLFD